MLLCEVTIDQHFLTIDSVYRKKRRKRTTHDFSEGRNSAEYNFLSKLISCEIHDEFCARNITESVRNSQNYPCNFVATMPNLFNIEESKHIYINTVNKIYYIKSSMFNVVI